MDMENVLLGKHEPLLTLCQLAELLDRSPHGLRISLNNNTPLSQFLKPKRLKIAEQLLAILKRLGSVELVRFEDSSGFVWVRNWWDHNSAKMAVATTLRASQANGCK